ncbi:uncharacterized protein [Watersipora subatra]|uniref:uncharacterized protein n=1 Tax=Watersipora subatra TaxID=2589382 RepID=UPI00355C43DD
MEQQPKSGEKKKEDKMDLLYDIETAPPWHVSIAIGLTHLLVFMGGAIGTCFAVAPMLCIQVGPVTNEVAKSEILSTLVFVCGLVTLLQTIFGSRLPIIQGASASFLPPAFAILSNFGDCPTLLPAGSNLTDHMLWNPNATETLIVSGSEEHDLIWKTKMRALQGAIMIASVVEIVLGFSGLLGFLLRFIGPLVIAITITLIGLPLFPLAASFSSSQWGISILCVALMLIFTQYMGKVKVGTCSKKQKDCSTTSGYPIFKLLAVILTITVAYLVCLILTYTNHFPNDSKHPFYRARTDIKLSALVNAKWFRVPYPGEFGVPTVTIGACFGMFAATLASMVESVGDYYAAARISGAPVPTAAALNRGIGIEGIGSLLSGAWGSGIGLTSYSMNIGTMNIVQVGSRRVIQVAAVLMIVLSVLGKFCALFVTIPDPVLGGIYIILFGMLASIGLSNLQYVDLNSPRNHFIIGASLMLGLTVPSWIKSNTDQIQTGSHEVDEIFVVLLSTNMFVGGVAAFFMDNTIPGTREERGMLVWSENKEASTEQSWNTRQTYDMPFGNSWIYSSKWTAYLPFCPNFGHQSIKRNNSAKDIADETEGSQGEQCYDGPAVSIEMESSSEKTKEKKEGEVDLLYDIETAPPWPLCIFIGLQHFIVFITGAVAMSLPLAPHLCITVGMETNDVVKAELIGTLVLTSGIVTLLQTLFGCRLPIIQGASASFLPPAFAILSNFGDCPTLLPADANITDYMIYQTNKTQNFVVTGSEEHDLIWKTRIRALQGAIMVASLVEIVLGFSGLLGFLLQYMGPLMIAPTISLIGLSLFPLAAENSSSQWGIAILCVALMVIFSQYMAQVKLPTYSTKHGGCSTTAGYPIFKLFPVLFTIIVAYIICLILTYTNVFPDDKQHPFYRARTDIRLSVLTNAKWFRVPYPGEWGMPTVTIGACFGMFAGILASMVESVGDYYAAARLSGAPVPTKAAINRGIGMEGIGCLLSGALGSGNGLTSYSGNIGAMNIIQVGSRRVIQVAAVFMLILSVLGKLCALFVTIPDPILGGIHIVLFGLLASVGLSNLQYVDLNSSRNLFVIGISLMLGLAIPYWTNRNKEQIQTGSAVLDEVCVVLLSTNMFIGGLMAFIMDNTIPGTLKERGMHVWANEGATSCQSSKKTRKTYDMPFGNEYIYRSRWSRYMPFCPNYGQPYRQPSFPSADIEEQVSDDQAREDVETAATATTAEGHC